jgi:hypothetical protein
MDDACAEESDGSLIGTAIRPPRLNDGPLTATYRTAIDRNGPDGPNHFAARRRAHDAVIVLQQCETAANP